MIRGGNRTRQYRTSKRVVGGRHRGEGSYMAVGWGEMGGLIKKNMNAYLAYEQGGGKNLLMAGTVKRKVGG